MANNFAYIEKTMPKVIDKVFAKESLTEQLIGGNEIKLDFLDARTVKIFKLASTALMNYNRGGHGSTNSQGSAQSTTETFTLSQERWSSIPLDKLDAIDDGETVLGALASEFLRTKVVPEFDAYRFSKLAGFTSVTIGNQVAEAISDNTILAKLTNAFKWFSEQKVPEGNQVIYVNPDIMAQIRTSTELTRFLTQADYKGDVNFTIEKFMGRPIVEVPSDEFYTEIVINSAGGYYPGANAKKINFLVVDKSAPIIVKKLDWAKVYDSDSQNLGYAGYLFDNLYYHDIFVPDNKKVGIYCSVSTTSAAGYGAGLLVDAVAGSTTNYTILQGAITQPAGILWDKIRVETSAPTIGDSVGSGTVVAQVNDYGAVAYTQFDAHSNSHTYLVAEFGGKVVAASKDWEDDLPKKA